MSSSASDTIFAYMMYLNAFDVKIVDEQGKLLVDDPKMREGMIKALESYTKPFKDRCVPPGSVNWQDSDNNVNFLNKITVMVPNPSLSIPASQKNTNPDNYNKNMVTFEWPDKPDGRPDRVHRLDQDGGDLQAGQEPGGRQGVHALLPAARRTSVRTSRARWRAGSRSTSAWSTRPTGRTQSDPHKVVEVRQYTQRPQTPWPHVFNHKLIQVNAENAWGKAVTRVVLESWPADKAVDELIGRIKQVAG